MDTMKASAATATATNTTGIPTTSSTTTAPSMSMPGMDMGGSGNCKSSMFWNWYTVDACFLSTKWHITSRGTFAASCIGVISLVLLLEFLRRLQREYDRLIQQRAPTDRAGAGRASRDSKRDENDDDGTSNVEDPPHSAVPLLGDYIERSFPTTRRASHVFTVHQQIIRAGIYTLQFAVAYMIMLLAMYYNGYVLLGIFIGAFVGFFVFSRDASGAANFAISENAACCA